MLEKSLQQYTIILASGSPRRHQFFKDLQLDFSIQTKEVDEIFSDTLKGTEITDYLCELKSNAFTELKDSDLLITADTIVWSNQEALGKPKDVDDAKNILQSLSGKTHEVMSSVCLRSNSKKVIFNDTTTVFFKELSKEEIEFYIENYQPFDKAGAYGIQDWIGLIGVEKIVGSYFNVMGLPVQKLYSELLKF
ncbi:Maf-like protein [Urechidicola sp. KH5]